MAGWILPLITSAGDLIGSGVKGFFGIKEKQQESLNNVITALGEANSSAASREQAIAQIIAAEAQSGYWLAAVWRPLTMVIFVGLIVAYFFGYTTPNLSQPFPENTALAEVFELVKLGLVGYIPARTVEKIAGKFATTRNLQLLTDYFAKKR